MFADDAVAILCEHVFPRLCADKSNAKLVRRKMNSEEFRKRVYVLRCMRALLSNMPQASEEAGRHHQALQSHTCF